MSENKTAKAIEQEYIKYAVKRGNEDTNPINHMSIDTGTELAYLFSKLNTDCDPMTDWSMRTFEFASLMKDLLILIGKPGMLEELHPINQDRASFQLMKLLEFFQALFDQETSKDWLTWLMLNQFSEEEIHPDHEHIIRNLHCNR